MQAPHLEVKLPTLQHRASGMFLWLVVQWVQCWRWQAHTCSADHLLTLREVDDMLVALLLT